jgi:hypothetical protein
VAPPCGTKPLIYEQNETVKLPPTIAHSSMCSHYCWIQVGETEGVGSSCPCSHSGNQALPSPSSRVLHWGCKVREEAGETVRLPRRFSRDRS